MTNDDNFDYGKLGRDWWLEAGESCRATPTQIKFACARHAGATRAKSAELAGYSASDSQGMRVAGSRADDTEAVQQLLTMASAASVGVTDDPFTVAEARKKIGRMVKTSLDPSTVIKGTELLAKLDQVDRERGQTPEDDGLADWRYCRDNLMQLNGASMFIFYYKALRKEFGHPANFPLLHDVWNASRNEVFGPQIWEWSCQSMSPEMRETLQQRLDDPKWQLEQRIAIWKEIGVDLTKVIKAA